MSLPENASQTLPPGVPPEAAEFLREMGYLQPDRLKVGDATPRFVLNKLNEDSPVVIGATDTARPTVLIFGSYT